MRKNNKLLILLITGLSLCSNLFGKVDKKSSIYLQLGSFENVKNAQKLKEKIAKEVNAPVKMTENKTFHVVSLGPLLNQQEAAKLKASLSKLSPDAHITHHMDAATLSKNDSVIPSKPPKISHIEPSSQIHHDTTPPKHKGAEKRLWNLEQADIRSVIYAVSKETGKNFVIDPRVQGKVSINSARPIDAQELYQVFLSILQVSGYAAIPSGKVVKIVPNMDARTLGMSTTPARNSGDAMVTDVIKLRYVPAEQLVPVLRPLMPQWSSVSAYAPSNTLILSGRADNIKRLHEIIYKVDDSDSNGIDVIQLHSALAMDVASTLKTLLDNRGGRNTQRQPTTIAADDKSNTILVSGSKADRLRIRILVSQIDREDGTGNGNTEIVYLRYLRAQDLVPILSGIAKANFSGTVGTTVGVVSEPHLDTSTPSNTDSNNSSSQDYGQQTSSPSNTEPNAGVAANTSASTSQSEGDKKPKVELIAEPNTNAIIISAPKAIIRTLRRVISKLDSRPAQLLVEALIAEIDEKVINQLGLEWGMVTTDTSGNDTFNKGFAIINTKTRLSQFQAQLYALVTSQKANILSTPSVVVLDNHQAKILIGKEVSIQDSNYPGNSGGAGVTNPYNTFTRQKVALHLYVRPQISLGKSVKLQIDQGNDTLADPTDATSGRPVINISNINTSVLVNSGDILVLGGLIQNGIQLSGNKLPILGDIPGIGELFQNNKHTRDKKVLMVFIRPIIISDPRSSIQVTGNKYFNVRQKELKYFQDAPYMSDYKQMVLPKLKKLQLPKPFNATKSVKKHYG